MFSNITSTFLLSVTCVKFEEDKLASGSHDKTVRVWDMNTGTCQHVLKGHTKGVWCLNFFTENLLVSGSYDGTIRVCITVYLFVLFRYFAISNILLVIPWQQSVVQMTGKSG